MEGGTYNAKYPSILAVDVGVRVTEDGNFKGPGDKNQNDLEAMDG